MSDVTVELELKLKAAQALDALERQSLATANKIEKSLQSAFNNAIKLGSNRIKLDVDSTGVKNATGDVKTLNAELKQTHALLKGIGQISPPRIPKSSTGTGGSRPANNQEQQLRTNAALTRQMQQEELRGLQQIAALEAQIARATVSASRGGTSARARQLQHEARLYQENVRHAQLLAKIKASPISPQAAEEATKLARALNSININSLNQQFNQLNQNARSGMGSAARRVGSLGANVAGGVAGAVAGAGLGLAGRALGRAGEALSSGLGASTALALQYGNALNTLQVNTSATTAEMEKINAAVLQSSSYFGVMPEQIAAMALELGRMGVNAQAMPAHLEAIGNTARATGQDFEVAMSAVEQLSQVFSDLSVDDISDVLTVAANVSPTGLQGIAQAFSFIGTSAELAGVSMETVSEQIVLLQKAGLESTIAGTSLNRLYTDIKENSDVFTEVGVQVFDASGKIRDMGTIIQETGAKMEGFTDEQRAAFLEPLDTNSVRALEILSKSYKEAGADVQAMRKQLQGARADNTAMAQAAKALQDPLVKLEQFQSKLAQLGLKLGQAFIPGIEGALTLGNEVVEALIDTDGLFNELKQSANEFKDYLAQNPQLARELAQGIAEAATVLGQSLLTKTRELLDYLQKNPQAIQQSIDGMVQFAGDLAAAANAAAKLVDFLGKAATLNSRIAGGAGIPAAVGALAGGIAGTVLMPGAGTVAGAAIGAGLFGGTAAALSENTHNTPTVNLGGSSGGVDVNRLREAIMGQESGGDSRAVNPDSGALGLYQVMPENVGPWSEQILGRRVSTDEFLNDANLQTQIVNGMMQGMINRALESSGGDAVEAIRRVAAEWYSGQQDLFDDTRPQTYGGGQYPSIAEYTTSVAQRYGATPASSYSASTASSPPQETEEARRVRMGGDAVDNPGPPSVPFRGIQVTSAVDASGEPGLDYVVDNGQRGAQFGSLTEGRVIETVKDQNWETNLESNPNGQRGYGNRVIVRTVDAITGEFVDMLYAHLDDVAVEVGDTVNVGTVLGTQGRTGSTTGAHVSVDFFGQDSNQATPGAIAMRDRVANTLANNPDSLNAQIRPGGNRPGNGPTTARETEAEQKRQEALRQARANQDEATRLARQQRDREIETRRSQADTTNAYNRSRLVGTSFEPEVERTIATTQARYQSEDAIRQATDDLEDLQRALERLDERKKEPGIAEVAKQYTDAIATQQEYIRGLQEQATVEQATRNRTQTAEAERAREASRVEMANRKAEQDYQNLSLEVQNYVATIKDANVADIIQQNFAIDETQNGFLQQAQLVEVEIAQLERQIKDANEAGLDPTSPEMETALEKLADLRDILNKIKENSDLKITIDTRVRDEALRAYQEDLRRQVTEGEAGILERSGDTFGANRIRREQAIEDQGQTSAARRNSLEALRGSVDPETFETMIADLERLDQIELTNIIDQFKTFGETAEAAGKQILSTFAQSLLSGKDFGESMMALFESITSALADMLIQMAMAEIFGSGLGSKGSGSSGLVDVLGQGLSILTMSQGNLKGVPNYADGLDAAFKRERSAVGAGKPYLAVVNDQEAILSAPQTKRFMELGLDKVVSRASGNLPQGQSLTPTGGGGVSVSVQNTFNAGNNVDNPAFTKVLQAQIRDTIRREQRPGNSLNR